MSENPYSASDTSSEIPATGNDSNLVVIAKLQRWLNFSILGYFAVIAIAGFSSPSNDSLMALVGFLMIGVGIFAFVTVIRLAKVMKGTVSAILHAIALLIPLVGLLVLLILNSRATRLLKEGGYKVGLLGAKPMAT